MVFFGRVHWQTAKTGLVGNADPSKEEERTERHAFSVVWGPAFRGHAAISSASPFNKEFLITKIVSICLHRKCNAKGLKIKYRG